MEKDKGKLDLMLTDSAVEQVRRLLARDNREGCNLRVLVSDGGCSGYSYKLDFDKAENTQDTVLRFDDLKVVIDAQSAPLLQGTVIDYVSGLYGGGFKFSNPNATGTCGCGTSFSV